MSDNHAARATRTTFTAYLAARLNAVAGRKDMTEIAREVGYQGPHIIEMFRSGTARVPLDKVGALAKALDVEPAYLAHLWMTSNMPADADLFGPEMSANEAQLLEIIREASQHSDPVVMEERRRQLQAIFGCSVTRN